MSTHLKFQNQIQNVLQYNLLIYASFIVYLCIITLTIIIIKIIYQMVKPSNRGKGKPSKRKNLKTKYKIQRKVKQHRKKLKKQAKKLAGTGIRPKKKHQSDTLPNMFPLKHQILQQFKQTLPKQAESLICQLNTAQFGLITLQNKPIYFNKSKQILTKKYITNKQAALSKCDIAVQVLQIRNPYICIDKQFRNQCQLKNKVRVIVLTKTDAVSDKQCTKIQQDLQSQGQIVLKFSHDHRFKNLLIQKFLQKINEIKNNMKLKNKNAVTLVIFGKLNTGKHTLISLLCKNAGKHQDIVGQLFQLNLTPEIKLIDAPFQLKDDTNFPLFFIPKVSVTEQSEQDGLIAQQQKILRTLCFGGLSFYKGPILNKEGLMQYYCIQDYVSVDDMLRKVGKSLKNFGKGGMIDLSKVRHKILSDWYKGSLIKIMNDMK